MLWEFILWCNCLLLFSCCVNTGMHDTNIHIIFFRFAKLLIACFFLVFWIIIFAGARKVLYMTEGWGEQKSDSTHGNGVALDLSCCWIILLVKDTTITSGCTMIVLLQGVRWTPTDILIQDKRCKNKELLKGQ